MSVSSFGGLQTSLRGLLAQQRALDVTGHNVANVGTAGFSRQEAVLGASPALPLDAGAIASGAGAQLGTGVQVEAYRRIRDQFLDVQYRAEAMQAGAADARAATLDRIETAVAEPGENGLSAQLDRFWNAWSDLATAPESAAARQSVVSEAAALADRFATLDRQLAAAGSSAASEAAGLLGPGGDVDQIGREIAGLDGAIRGMIETGQQPSDLLDRRDLLLDKLAALGQVSVTDLGSGSISVRFGDAAEPLTTGSSLNWPQSVTAPGGRTGALLTAANQTVPAYRAELAASARQVVDAVNAAHVAGGGAAVLAATPGAEAATMSVAITGAALRPGSSGASGTGDVATTIAALRGGTGDKTYQALITRLGVDAREATRSAASSTALRDAVADRRDSVAGVSLDEEMTNLVRFQRGYQASARIMSTMDETLETLINRTGRVGL